MDEAIQAATNLKAQLADKDVAAAYPELEIALHAFEEAGYPIESILPQGADSALGFSLKTADGKTFYQVYAKLIHKSLCGPGGEFNKLIKSGLSTSVGAVMTAIVTSLGLPLLALPVIVPIVAIIANTGLDTFCEMVKAEP